MNKDFDVSDFPKLHSPFVREENDKGEYVLTPKIQEGYEWVFDEAKKVKAVEKVDGSCMSAVMRDGKPEAIFARLGPNTINRIPIWSKDTQNRRIIEGVLNAFHKGWLDKLSDGQHFGELIGPKFGSGDDGNVNPYDMEEHIFYPFKRARKKLEMKSYGKYGTSFEDIKEWFIEQGLIHLFYAKWHGISLEEAEERGFVEGAVFWHPETGEMAKLRRDMYTDYRGDRH